MTDTTRSPQIDATSILNSGFAVLRNINPTRQPGLYGDAWEIFGSDVPERWDAKEVEALCNINGLLACGLENLPHFIAEGGDVDREMRWLIERLDTAEVPSRVYNKPVWEQFCAKIAGRRLGVPLPSAPPPVDRIAEPARPPRPPMRRLNRKVLVAAMAVSAVVIVSLLAFALTPSRRDTAALPQYSGTLYGPAPPARTATNPPQIDATTTAPADAPAHQAGEREGSR